MLRALTASLLMLVSTLCFAQSVLTFIPPQAIQYLPVVKTESDRLMVNFDHPYYFGALIEHESCISLKHKRCWNPKSQLKTSREEGAGLGQITRTYRPDGSSRFDVLTELRERHLEELKELSWQNVYERPDLQIRSMILLSKENYKYFYNIPDQFERLAMTDAAYNGGRGGVFNERRACGLAANCDPGLWFGHVEKYCLKSKKPLYGNRSACDINRHHVEDVLHTRLPKYKQKFSEF